VNVEIDEIRACTQEVVGGGEVRISLIKLGPLRCLIPTEMEHGGECSNGRSTKAVNDMICAPYLILDVEMELLHVCGPLLMAVILQLPLCLYELQRIVNSVDDFLLSKNVMFPLMIGLCNVIHFLIIGGVFMDGI
jgi:hypothetical protein